MHVKSSKAILHSVIQKPLSNTESNCKGPYYSRSVMLSNCWRFPIHSFCMLTRVTKCLQTSDNEKKKASKEKYAIDGLPNGKAHWLSLPFLSFHLETWHYYNQISNCDLSKHAGIWTCHNAHTEGCWSEGDIPHSRVPSLWDDLMCPPADCTSPTW